MLRNEVIAMDLSSLSDVELVALLMPVMNEVFQSVGHELLSVAGINGGN